jgi:hypothetical protein
VQQKVHAFIQLAIIEFSRGYDDVNDFAAFVESTAGPGESRRPPLGGRRALRAPKMDNATPWAGARFLTCEAG